MHIRNRNFESATGERWVAPKIHVCISQLLLRNCISEFPQSTVEVQTKKKLRLRTFKVGLQQFRNSQQDLDSENWDQNPEMNKNINSKWQRIRIRPRVESRSPILKSAIAYPQLFYRALLRLTQYCRIVD